MYCPKCKSEYRKGITYCSDCGVELVEELPKKEKKQMVLEDEGAYEMTSLMTVADKTQCDLLLNMLKNNGISCYSTAASVGGYTSLYTGKGAFGEEIFVHKQDYADAYTLCQSMLQQDGDLEEDEEFDREVELMHERQKAYNRMVTYGCRAILLLGISVTLVVFIMDVFLK